MPSIFTRIIEGELPGVFVWRDPQCVAFLSINPMHPGHTLVVPRAEVDHWIDLDPELNTHLFRVAQTIGQAQDRVLDTRRIGLLIVGDEVPHVHIHVVPFDAARELSFAKADPNPPEGSLEAAAQKIRAALRDLGADSVSE
jgi:histidine triad (HIT) family protein